MNHPFGILISRHLHRKYGLRQSKLAAGIQGALDTLAWANPLLDAAGMSALRESTLLPPGDRPMYDRHLAVVCANLDELRLMRYVLKVAR